MNFVPNMGNTEDELHGAACDTQWPPSWGLERIWAEHLKDRALSGDTSPKPGRQRGRGSVASESDPADLCFRASPIQCRKPWRKGPLCLLHLSSPSAAKFWLLSLNYGLRPRA